MSWSDNPRGTGTFISLRIARLHRDGTFGRAADDRARSTPASRPLEVDGLGLAFPRGGPVAAWQVFHDISEAGDGAKDQTRIDSALSAGGAFAAPQTRSLPGALTGLPVVGAAADSAAPRVARAGRRHLAPAPAPPAPADGGWGPTRTFADIDGAIADRLERATARWCCGSRSRRASPSASCGSPSTAR